MVKKDDSAENLAKNLAVLRKSKHISQDSLALLAGVKQGTISHMEHPGVTATSTVASVEKVAQAFKLKAWQLLLPKGLAATAGINNLEKIIENYCECSPIGQQAILRVSEAEKRYSMIETNLEMAAEPIKDYTT